MRNKQQLEPKREMLGSEEWCFLPEKVPTTQLVGCFVHEYGRELTPPSPATLKLMKLEADRAAANLAHNILGEIKPGLNLRKIMRGYLPAFRHICGAEFPKTSWQKLD